MTIGKQLIIRAKIDSCTVTKTEKGNVIVGSIQLDPSEVEEFLNLLAAAIRTALAEPK